LSIGDVEFGELRFDAMTSFMPAVLAMDEGQEYDESAADDVKMVTCPHCGEAFPK